MLETDSGKLHRLRPAQKPADTGLSHYWVYGLAQASTGEVWIGTFGGGIDVVDPGTFKVIDRLHHGSALTNSIGNSVINTTNLTVGSVPVRVDFANVTNISGSGGAGSVYEFDVTINYTSPNGLTSKQIGGKPFVGKYT